MLRPGDQVDEQQNEQTPVKVPLNQETVDAVLKATEETYKPPVLDPYILFTQIEGLRKEGVPEETIREAFNQFMQERQFPKPKALNSMKRHPGSLPMPTQEEINKMYLKAHEDRVVSPEMELLIEEVENAKTRRVAVEQASKFSFRGLRDKTARSVMVFILRVTIFVFKRLGVR